MKWTFKLDKFLKNLPAEQASAVSEAVRGIENPTVQRKSMVVDITTEKNTSAGYMSTPQLDRDREVVVSDGIDLTAFKQNPVLLYNHKWADPPIGSNPEVWTDDKGLFAKQSYASTPFAQDIYTLVREKHLRTFSIGFVSVQRAYKGDNGFQDAMERVAQKYPNAPGLDRAEVLTMKSILLENSVVNIPCNTGAEVLQVGKALNLSARTIEELGIEIVEEKQESGPILIPKIRLISRAKTIDIAEIVEKKISLMKGGI